MSSSYESYSRMVDDDENGKEWLELGKRPRWFCPLAGYHHIFARSSPTPKCDILYIGVTQHPIPLPHLLQLYIATRDLCLLVVSRRMI